MNEEVPTIRDCFAMFAMMEARNAKPEIGIKTVRKGKK